MMPANRFSFRTQPGTESRVAAAWPDIIETMEIMCRGFVAAEAYAAYTAKQQRQPHNKALAQLWANALYEARRNGFGTFSDVPPGFEIIAD